MALKLTNPFTFLFGSKTITETITVTRRYYTQPPSKVTGFVVVTDLDPNHR